MITKALPETGKRSADSRTPDAARETGHDEARPVQQQSERRWQVLHWLMLVELAILTAALIFSWITMNTNTTVQHEMKQIDLMRHFQDRYDKIIWEVSKEVTDERTANAYFDRYWNLQLEQYEYWKQGLIDDDVFAYWMKLRRESYMDAEWRPFEETLPDYTYKQGWEHARLALRIDLHTFDFSDFMADVMTTDRDISDILRQYHRG